MARIEFPFSEVGKTVAEAGLGCGEGECSVLNMLCWTCLLHIHYIYMADAIGASPSLLGPYHFSCMQA